MSLRDQSSSNKSGTIQFSAEEFPVVGNREVVRSSRMKMAVMSIDYKEPVDRTDMCIDYNEPVDRTDISCHRIILGSEYSS